MRLVSVTFKQCGRIFPTKDAFFLDTNELARRAEKHLERLGHTVVRVERIDYHNECVNVFIS